MYTSRDVGQIVLTPATNRLNFLSMYYKNAYVVHRFIFIQINRKFLRLGVICYLKMITIIIVCSVQNKNE